MIKNNLKNFHSKKWNQFEKYGLRTTKNGETYNGTLGLLLNAYFTLDYYRIIGGLIDQNGFKECFEQNKYRNYIFLLI